MRRTDCFLNEMGVDFLTCDKQVAMDDLKKIDCGALVVSSSDNDSLRLGLLILLTFFI